MLQYSQRRNPKPLEKPQYYKNKNHDDLYKLDRIFVVMVEKFGRGDLHQYDRNMRYERDHEHNLKCELIRDTTRILKNICKYREDDLSFKLSFNDFNGYKIEYNGKKYETYNYLGDKYVMDIFFGEQE